MFPTAIFLTIPGLTGLISTEQSHKVARTGSELVRVGLTCHVVGYLERWPLQREGGRKVDRLVHTLTHKYLLLPDSWLF